MNPERRNVGGVLKSLMFFPQIFNVRGLPMNLWNLKFLKQLVCTNIRAPPIQPKISYLQLPITNNGGIQKGGCDRLTNSVVLYQ